MAPASTKQWLFSATPVGTPTISGPDATFTFTSVDLPPVPVESVMAETAPLSRTTTLGSDGQRDDAERLAACFNCKRSKLKCVRAGGSATCTRCRQRRIECTAPAYHVGRHKGVKK